MIQTELKVPSDLKFLNIVESWLLGCLAMELGDWPDWPKWESRLRLVIVEAYSNVVRHAHENQPQLLVHLKLEIASETLFIEVWDQGKGFDMNTYLPPAPNVRQEGGYGWLILNRLMDKVEYQIQSGGPQNCLKLQIELPQECFMPTMPKYQHPLRQS